MTEWIRSSFCEATSCMEVSEAGGVVLVRDSLRPNLMIVLSQRDWADFVQGVKAGDFDRLGQQ